MITFENKKLDYNEISYDLLKVIKLCMKISILEMEDLLTVLESKFGELNLKIEKKIELINRSYELDVEKVIIRLKENENGFNVYENNINQHRDVLLKQINLKLNEIQNFNGEIKFLENLKENFVYFNKSFGLCCCLFELILSEFEISPRLDLSKIDKYYELIISKKKIQLSLPETIVLESINNQRQKFLVLPLNRLLICAVIDHKHTIFIVDSNGNIVCSKKLDYNYKLANTLLKSTASKIFHLYEMQHEKSNRLNIYNLKLELVRSIKFSQSFYLNVIIYKNEFALHNIFSNRVLIYNTNSFKSTSIQFQTAEENADFYVYSKVYLLNNLNEKHLYFYGHDCVYIVKRTNGTKLAKVRTNINSFFVRLDIAYSIKFDRYSNIYYFENQPTSAKLPLIIVYDSDGKYLCEISRRKQNENFILTYKDSCIFNYSINKNVIIYQEF